MSTFLCRPREQRQAPHPGKLDGWVLQAVLNADQGLELVEKIVSRAFKLGRGPAMTTQFKSDLREAVKNQDEGIFAVYDGCVAAADLLSNIYNQPRVGKVSGRIIQDEIRRPRIWADAAATLIERMPPSDERARVMREAIEYRTRAA